MVLTLYYCESGKDNTVIGILELHAETVYYIMRNAENYTSHRHSAALDP
jgi:hypothetical protein